MNYVELLAAYDKLELERDQLSAYVIKLRSNAMQTYDLLGEAISGEQQYDFRQRAKSAVSKSINLIKSDPAQID